MALPAKGARHDQPEDEAYQRADGRHLHHNADDFENDEQDRGQEQGGDDFKTFQGILREGGSLRYAAVVSITVGFLITEASPLSFSPKPLEKSWKMAASSSLSI